MSSRTVTATAMAFRDQRRRPLVLVLIVLVPAYVILWSVAETKPTLRTIELPGGEWVTTTMKALHGPEMASLMIAFLAALVGVFVTHSALQGDRRLVLAGFRAREAVLARLLVVTAATLLAVAVSAAIMATVFTPASWPPVIAALLLTGRISAGHPTAAIGLEFDAIAAVIVGGTSFERGNGTLVGTLIGVLTIGVLKNGLNVMSVSSSLQVASIGVLVIAALVIDSIIPVLGRPSGSRA